ncbi:MAG: HAD-IC family P-type ATPase, partial [Rhodothermia bacterium]|nr:HAD-IC family P-type ATPase [Rhodothermia bacterium]
MTTSPPAKTEISRISAIGDGVRPPPGSTVWSAPISDVARLLSTDIEVGLSDSEVTGRRRRFGPNVLDVRPPVGAFEILVRQFRSVIILLLAGAFVVALIFGESLEAIAIVAVIVLNTAIGFVTELRAERSMEALLRLGSQSARAMRSGQVRIVPAEELVPGDVVTLEAGDVVPADLRILESSRLESDESVLTGESLPVSKAPKPVGVNSPIHERSSMLYKGAAVSRGTAKCVVFATGQATELGQIADLSRRARSESTPLERRLDRLGRRLVGLTVIIGVLIAVIGVATDKDLYLMLQTAVALAVAAIPEGLPIVATIALAAGVRRMARRNVLVNRLASVETLGSTHVIFTDKTGTLTENRMSVAEVVTAEGRVEADDFPDVQIDASLAGQDPFAGIALVSALCNDVVSGEDNGGGEPMERALFRWLDESGICPEDLRGDFPREGEEAFDPEVKMMATYHRLKHGYLMAIKGAPEEVIVSSTRVIAGGGPRTLDGEQREGWLDHSQRMGMSGQRVLAMAIKMIEDRPERDPYSGLDLLGLVGLYDPPREDVRSSLADCESAGLTVVMVTGDQPGTAASVAASVGLGNAGGRVVLGSEVSELPDALSGAPPHSDLLDVRIFARVSPREKLDLISMHQRAGRVVAMTGDGVNDAPALKKADIGIAMGARGTEVAKEAADVVLLDDAFTSIVEAIRQGRIIFDNIRTFVVYLMSCNLSEVLVVGVSTLAGGPLPILPLQILFLNLVTDVFPALALGVSPG